MIRLDYSGAMSSDNAPAKPKKDVMQKVTPEAIRQAKTLMRTERSGALAVIDPESGAPMASRVALATDQAGAPIILISQLSSHFGALQADPRCSLMLGQPGKGDPLAHPRIMLQTRAEKLDGNDRTRARARFIARNPKAALYADFGDFAFWRLTPEKAALNGGFAKAFEMRAEDVLCSTDQDLADMEEGAVAHMNDDHLDAIKLYAEVLARAPAADWQLATMDLEGMDMIAGDLVSRVWFEPPLEAASELRIRLVEMAKAARA
ncbi:MAG: DUF2470 domain-containing protein [Pseudomonadota bacterium]